MTRGRRDLSIDVSDEIAKHGEREPGDNLHREFSARHDACFAPGQTQSESCVEKRDGKIDYFSCSTILSV